MSISNPIIREIEKATDALISDVKSVYDKVAEVDLKDVSFDTVIGPLIAVECEHATREGPLSFAQHCSTSKARFPE